MILDLTQWYSLFHYRIALIILKQTKSSNLPQTFWPPNNKNVSTLQIIKNVSTHYFRRYF